MGCLVVQSFIERQVNGWERSFCISFPVGFQVSCASILINVFSGTGVILKNHNHIDINKLLKTCFLHILYRDILPYFTSKDLFSNFMLNGGNIFKIIFKFKHFILYRMS